MVLRMWGSETRKFGLSSELIMKIDHRTEIEKLTFSAVALHDRRANAVRWSIFIINSIDKPFFHITN